jgi:hypothetical protein
MESSSWIVPAAFLLIIGIPLAAVIAYVAREELRGRRNRVYKTLADHNLLNDSDRAVWASGELPGGETVKVDVFSGRIAPIAQLVTVAVLAVIVLMSNQSLVNQNARLEQRVSDLDLQVHALALTASSNGSGRAEQDGEPQQGIALGQGGVGTPLQQVCANLIGRVADAYQKGESSKIGQSLEELVSKIGCQKVLAPP